MPFFTILFIHQPIDIFHYRPTEKKNISKCWSCAGMIRLSTPFLGCHSYHAIITQLTFSQYKLIPFTINAFWFQMSQVLILGGCLTVQPLNGAVLGETIFLFQLCVIWLWVIYCTTSTWLALCTVHWANCIITNVDTLTFSASMDCLLSNYWIHPKIIWL